VALKDIGNSIFDAASIGYVIAKKSYARALADERDIDPGVAARAVAALHTEHLPVRVSEVIQETESTKTLRLVPAGDAPLFPFRPGQFATIFVDIDGTRTSRAYSISSPPSHTGHIDITVRRMPNGYVSKYLVDEVAEGDTFELSGPGGFFYHEPLIDTSELVFLAGGSGITPFMSMIREAIERDSGLAMNLIYGSRTADDVIFWDELSELACSCEGLAVNLVLSEPPESYEGTCGLLDAENIDRLVGDLSGKTFYMCGPHAMYGLCGESLEQLAVPVRRVKKELSGPPPDITMVEGWPTTVAPTDQFTVKVAGTRKHFPVAAREPLLNSLERNGISVDCLCRSGECGVCRTALAEGSVFMPAEVGLRKSDLACGYIHPCMSYPISDITIRL